MLRGHCFQSSRIQLWNTLAHFSWFKIFCVWYICVWVCSLVPVSWEARCWILVSSSVTLQLIFETRSLRDPGVFWFREAGWPWYLLFLFTALPLRPSYTTPGFFINTGDLNSDPNGCKSLQLIINIFNWIYLSTLKIGAKWKKLPYLTKFLVVLR